MIVIRFPITTPLHKIMDACKSSYLALLAPELFCCAELNLPNALSTDAEVAPNLFEGFALRAPEDYSPFFVGEALEIDGWKFSRRDGLEVERAC